MRKCVQRIENKRRLLLVLLALLALLAVSAGITLGKYVSRKPVGTFNLTVKAATQADTNDIVDVPLPTIVDSSNDDRAENTVSDTTGDQSSETENGSADNSISE